MPIKEVLQRCRPIPLYVVLILSICYFVLQLVLSHLTHALTLLMASYHMLCNILALGGCVITIKVSGPTTYQRHLYIYFLFVDWGSQQVFKLISKSKFDQPKNKIEITNQMQCIELNISYWLCVEQVSHLSRWDLISYALFTFKAV